MINRDKAKLVIAHFKLHTNSRRTYTKFKLTAQELKDIMKLYYKSGNSGFYQPKNQDVITPADLFLRRKLWKQESITIQQKKKLFRP